MAVLDVVRTLYRSALPSAVRSSALVVRLKERLLGHEWIYDADYYRRIVEGPAVRSAPVIAGSVMQALRPRRVIDVGCGTGALLAELRRQGCDVAGLEYSDAGLAYCRSRQLPVTKFNLERDGLHDDERYDVAVSMEVAEHLPERAADRYVGLLARLSEVIVFTAAPPGQGGEDHVNEQPREYWIDKFRQRGYGLLGGLTAEWQQAWQADGRVAHWYHQNLMVFRRDAG